MDGHLRSDWVELCLMPHNVRKESWDKFTACLLGDEKMNDEEFAKAFGGGGGCGDGSCQYCYQGACAHPFRPGSLVGMIAASVWSSTPNAKPLWNEKEKEYLDHRGCFNCSDCCSQKRLFDSAFKGLERFYEDILEKLEKGYPIPEWEEYRKRNWGPYFDGIEFFPDGGRYAQYEDNIRKHFLNMVRRDYDKAVAVLSEKCEIGKYDEHKKHVAECIGEIRFGLLTHFITYWSKEGYKNA